MELLMFIFVTVIPVISDGLIVKGPSGPLVAPVESSVVLPCSVDQLLSVEDLEVEWRRTDSDILVHLYQDGESRPESQQQDYQDRAHFFTEQIQHGNFSLHLDNLRAEDEGKYTCNVYSQQESNETVVEIIIDDVENLRVSGSDQSISASVGEDITLKCSVDSHITLEDIEEVSWKKTDEDEDIMVLLYQDQMDLPEASDERYRDRVEFFTDETPKLNFSLRLKSVRTEDKGVYMCEVFAGGLSANTTVELERLGFSVLHIMVLILCISASVSALLLCCLIYCRSKHKGFYGQQTYNHKFDLGSSVVLPCHVDKHLLKKKLKVEWRRKDTKTLVHLYQDRESRPQQDYQDRAHFFTDEIQHGNFSLRLDDLRAEDAGEYICKVHSDLFSVTRTAETSLVPQFSVKGSIGNQTVSLGDSVVLPCQVDKSLLQKSLKVEWKRAETLVHLYEDDAVGWGCVLVFLQILWVVMRFMDVTYGFLRISRGFRRFVAVYVFGSVGVVLLNSAALIIELILKTVIGHRIMADLRFIVFPSECLFAIFVLISAFFPSEITNCLQSCQNKVKSFREKRSRKNQSTDETELSPLNTGDQEQNQPVSVVSQT
ncbi:butyrophilin-like protein 2 [Garra rufa]|uniref:butyrophilin-like protein 2 n=1 Tax=Garra rufa TaxID=137080 RepID=UPI003CCE7875